MKNPFRFDTALVVSVQALTEVLGVISHEAHQWKLIADTDNHVTISYSNPTQDSLSAPEMNQLEFTFPIVADVPLFGDDDGRMVCLYPMAAEQVRRGLYMEDNQVKNDEMHDWQKFWEPIEEKLAGQMTQQGYERLKQQLK